MKMEELEKAIKDITELIQPHLIDAFCGYDENSKSFDVVLAIKEILEHKENVDKTLYELKVVCEDLISHFTTESISIIRTLDCIKRKINAIKGN